jgi:pyrroloquinoline quinone (PQQ) biosynthesis protein C
MRTTLYERLGRETGQERNYLLSTPQIQAALAGRISRQTYLDYLAQAYHHVKHTAPLFRTARAHLSERQAAFIPAFEDYVIEEEGHDEWILRDIRAAGGDADRVRMEEPAPATEFMVAYAYDYVTRKNALGLLGMVFVLEGTSVALAQQGAAAVAGALELGPECFTYLNSHGALDQDHMNVFRSLMAMIDDPHDQDAVVHVAKRMYLLFGGVFHSIAM